MFQETRVQADEQQNGIVRCTEFGVFLMTPEPNSGWKPKGVGSKPPLRTDGLPFDLAMELVTRLNRRAIEEDRQCWTMVVRGNVGYGVLRINLGGTEVRPTDPTAWPPGMRLETVAVGEAKSLRRDLNASILKTARVPRIWAVMVRRPVADLVPSAMVPGV